ARRWASFFAACRDGRRSPRWVPCWAVPPTYRRGPGYGSRRPTEPRGPSGRSRFRSTVRPSACSVMACCGCGGSRRRSTGLITDEELARQLRATPTTAGPYPVVTVEPGPVDGLLSQLLLYFELHPEHAEVSVRRGDVLLGYLA